MCRKHVSGNRCKMLAVQGKEQREICRFSLLEYQKLVSRFCVASGIDLGGGRKAEIERSQQKLRKHVKSSEEQEMSEWSNCADVSILQFSANMRRTRLCRGSGLCCRAGAAG